MQILRIGIFKLKMKSAEDILLEDFERVEALSKSVAKVEGKDFQSQIIRAEYYREVVQTLALQKVRWYHLFFINQILDAVGFLKRVESPEKYAKANFQEFIAWMSARLNLSERMVLAGFTTEGARRASTQIMKREIERSMENIHTKVDPSGHLQTLMGRIEELKETTGQINGVAKQSRGVVGIIGAVMGKT